MRPLPAFIGVAVLAASGAADSVDPARIQQVEAMLADHPTAFGPSITNRPAWEELGGLPAFRDVVRNAERLLKESLPDQPDDLYLEFSRNGNRTRWQRVAGRRRDRVAAFALAEAMEHKGRFLPAFADTAKALCAERTWVMPAHDRQLNNFNGKVVDIDLGSSMLAWQMATALVMLGDRLDPSVRTLLEGNIRRRILDPFRDTQDGRRGGNGWMRATHNWNAVCHAGVVGSAFGTLTSRADRAYFVVAAEANLRSFFDGFTGDGYCSEGMGYWNYGFGYFVMLAELVRQSTGGRLDWMTSPTVQPIAAFARRMEIVNGVFPAFADCGVGARPGEALTAYLNRCFPVDGEPSDPRAPAGSRGSLYDVLMYAFPADRPAVQKAVSLDPSPLRSWFNEAGVLICRMAPGTSARFGAALKGGHNAEHHNHNDIGSYVVVVGRVPVVLDAGGEQYTARTFSARRYESRVLNSYGHPVPVAAGALQQEGATSRAKVLETVFRDDADRIKFDLASAYSKAPGLKTLTRTFLFAREGAGSLTVRDEVEFDRPREFGTALITLGRWSRDGAALMVEDGGEAVRVDVSTDGPVFSARGELIEEDVPRKPTRIGLSLTTPVQRARIEMKITPVKR